MEKTYIHRKTGELAYYKDGIFKQGNCVVEIGVEPSSEFWLELTYEILSFRSKTNSFYSPTMQKDGTYLDAKLMKFDGMGASLEWMLNEDEYCITSVKRLSDSIIFERGDLTNAGKIEMFELHGEHLMVKTDGGLTNFDNGLRLKKEATLTTEDGVELFNKWDKYYVPQKNNRGDLTGSFLEFEVAGYTNGDSSKRFSSKVSAEKYIKENRKRYSLNDIKGIVKKLNCFGSTLIEYLENDCTNTSL